MNTTELDDVAYVEKDGKIYEILRDKNGDIVGLNFKKEGVITQPRIHKVEVVEKTNKTATIKTEAVRMEGGTFYYYISDNKKDFGEPVGNNQNGENTFNIPDRDKDYYIKVVGKNTQGEESSKIIQTKIESVPEATDDNIFYQITWTNGKANLKLSNKANYGFDIETSLDGVNYRKTNNLTNLANGTIVYARLVSDAYSGKAREIKVIDSIKPKINVSIVNVTSRSIQIQATSTDNESEFSAENPYKFYIATDENNLAQVSTNKTGNYTFDRLTANTTYFIKATREDDAKNEGAMTITSETKAIPDAQVAIKRDLIWNPDGNVDITLSTTEDYTIMYSLDNNKWNKYGSTIRSQNGKSVYIRLSDEINNGRNYEIKLSDYEGPKITLARGKTTTSSIIVNATTEDSISGMPETPLYSYYIKKSNESTYNLIATEIADNQYKFTGLTANTTYNIKVMSKDKIGNEGEQIIDASTQDFMLVNGNIEFKNEKWEGEQVEVTIKNNTDNNIQYQVIGNGVNLSDTAWQTADAKEQIVQNLKNGDIVVARLYDGTNYTGYSTHNVNDTKTPQIEKVEKSKEEWVKDEVQVSIIAKDLESGLAEAPYSFDRRNFMAKRKL